MPAGKHLRAPALNLARLDLVSLHLVLRCAACGAISRAAHDCHLSVMGASQRLRRLEDSLGKPLFHRHRRGLELTEAGRVVVRGAAAILAAAAELVQAVDEARVCEPVRAAPGRRARPRCDDAPNGSTLPSNQPFVG